MILHLSAAAHHIAPCRVKNAVAGTARNVHGLQNMDMRTRHLSVTHQKTGCCQRCKSTSYDIGIFFIHALRFFRAGKCLIISIAVVNSLAVLFIFSTLCIAVFRINSCFSICFFLSCFIFLICIAVFYFFCHHCSSGTNCHCGCHT